MTDEERTQRAARLIANARRAKLSPREREALVMWADGSTNEDVATRMGVSVHTAKFHANAVLLKLSAHSRMHAVAIGFRAGLIPMEVA